MSSNIADEQFWSELAILLDTPWPGGEPGVILDPGSGSGSLVTIDQPAPPLDGDVVCPPFPDLLAMMTQRPFAGTSSVG